MAKKALIVQGGLDVHELKQINVKLSNSNTKISRGGSYER